MRGRPPKPTKLRVFEGNPGKRRLPRSEVRPVVPLHKPEIVSAAPAADAAWERAVSAMPSGFYTDADAAVLAMHAMAWASYVDAIETISQAYAGMHAEENFTYYIEKGIGHVLSDEMWKRTKAVFEKYLS